MRQVHAASVCLKREESKANWKSQKNKKKMRKVKKNKKYEESFLPFRKQSYIFLFLLA
jgi:hypothetical protein